MNTIEKLLRIQEIGKLITQLTEESRKLRYSVAPEIEKTTGVISEEKETVFLCAKTLVRVKKVRGMSDYTFLFEELKELTCTN